MRFENFADLVAMSGHGPYVWSAYAIAIVVLALNVVWPLVQKKRNLKALREEMQREEVMLNQGKQS